MKKALNPVLIFSGEVSTFARKGSGVTCKCKFGSGVFETDLPVLVKGTSCPHLRGSYGDGSHLISQGCTGPDAVMKKANWSFSGSITGAPSAAYPFQVQLDTFAGIGAGAIASLAANAIFLNWFGFGYIEWGAGANIQRRMIVGSTVPVAGAVTLTLHRYFSAVPTVGDVVKIYPGCDGQAATCKAYNAGNNPTGKFNNYLNFGGDPLMPIGNPSVVGQQTTGTQGGKK